MEQFIIYLKPYGRDSQKLSFYEEKPVFSINNLDNLINNRVYSDLTYTFEILTQINIDSITVYINGYEIPSSYNNGIISFNKGRIFSDYFGFVQISIDINTSSKEEISLHSDFLNVMVKNKTVTKSINLMSEYIYNNQDKLLLDNNMHSLNTSSLRNKSPKSLEVYVKIVSNIVNTYQLLYRTFMINSQYILKADYKIDKFEKLSYVDSNNINYIVQHPEQFKEIGPGRGIHIKRKSYLPDKTLVSDNVISYDIYENKIVLGFIHNIINSIKILSDEISSKLSIIDNLKKEVDGYEISAGYIYSVTRKKFQDFKIKTYKLKNDLNYIYHCYKRILPIKELKFNSLPKPTHIFMNIKHYNSIYRCIEQWYNFGIYELQKENFLLPLLANSQLYEYYLLLKMYNYFCDIGFTMTLKERFKYNQKNDKYKETAYCNTFIFCNNKITVTLYYQPVINKDNSEKNGIGLFRNNCIPYLELASNKYYYLPDFLVKIESGKKKLYVVLDAKFSTIDNVKKYYFSDLVFKYIYSLTPSDSNSILAGLCAINGQFKNKYEHIESIYNENVPNSYLPYSEIMTFIENNDKDSLSKQKLLLDNYFKKYFKLLAVEDNN